MEAYMFCSGNWWLGRSSDNDCLSPEVENLRRELGHKLRDAKGFVNFEPWWELNGNLEVLYDLLNNSIHSTGGDLLTAADKIYESHPNRDGWRGSSEQIEEDRDRVNWLESVRRAVVGAMRHPQADEAVRPEIDRKNMALRMAAGLPADLARVRNQQAEQLQRSGGETPIRKPSPFKSKLAAQN